jgi:hypothetical protein
MTEKKTRRKISPNQHEINMKNIGNEKALAARLLAADQANDQAAMNEAARALATAIQERRVPRPVIRSMTNIDGEPDALKHVRIDNDTGVMAHIENRPSTRIARTTSLSISCPSLGPGSSPEQARELAYSLLVAASTAESIAGDMNRITSQLPSSESQ